LVNDGNEVRRELAKVLWKTSSLISVLAHRRDDLISELSRSSQSPLINPFLNGDTNDEGDPEP